MRKNDTVLNSIFIHGVRDDDEDDDENRETFRDWLLNEWVNLAVLFVMN